MIVENSLMHYKLNNNLKGKTIMKKRLVSLLLLVMMILGSSLSANAKYFSDLTIYLDEEVFDAINYMSDNGYMNGTSEGVFNPDLNVTRGMLVYLLYVYSGDSGTYTHPFTDVSSSQYYANAVGWAYQNQVVSGTSTTTFSPNNTLTVYIYLKQLCNSI